MFFQAHQAMIVFSFFDLNEYYDNFCTFTSLASVVMPVFFISLFVKKQKRVWWKQWNKDIFFKNYISFFFIDREENATINARENLWIVCTSQHQLKIAKIIATRFLKMPLLTVSGTARQNENKDIAVDRWIITFMKVTVSMSGSLGQVEPSTNSY